MCSLSLVPLNCCKKIPAPSIIPKPDISNTKVTSLAAYTPDTASLDTEPTMMLSIKVTKKVINAASITGRLIFKNLVMNSLSVKHLNIKNNLRYYNQRLELIP